jgi:hypothetical protein
MREVVTVKINKGAQNADAKEGLQNITFFDN